MLSVEFVQSVPKDIKNAYMYVYMFYIHICVYISLDGILDLRRVLILFLF